MIMFWSFWELKERYFGRIFLEIFLNLFESWAKKESFPDKIFKYFLCFDIMFFCLFEANTQENYQPPHPYSIIVKHIIYSFALHVRPNGPTKRSLQMKKYAKKTGGSGERGWNLEILLQITRKSEKGFMGRFVYSLFLPNHCQCPAPSCSPRAVLYKRWGVLW